MYGVKLCMIVICILNNLVFHDRVLCIVVCQNEHVLDSPTHIAILVFVLVVLVYMLHALTELSSFRFSGQARSAYKIMSSIIGLYTDLALLAQS